MREQERAEHFRLAMAALEQQFGYTVIATLKTRKIEGQGVIIEPEIALAPVKGWKAPEGTDGD